MDCPLILALGLIERVFDTELDRLGGKAADRP
jgi:hypothetical protein